MPKQNVNQAGVAIEGYDPVSYFSGQPVKGLQNLVMEHDGATFWFASQQNLDTFRSDLQRYHPLYGGWCGVAVSEGKYVPVDPKTFLIHDDRIVLFYNSDQGNTKPQWEEDPTRRKTNADKHWKEDDLVDP